MPRDGFALIEKGDSVEGHVHRACQASAAASEGPTSGNRWTRARSPTIVLTSDANTLYRAGGNDPKGLPPRIRVIEVTRSLNVGGLERVVSTLASGLDPSRFDVSVVCLLRTGYFAQELARQGIRIHLASRNSQHTHYLLFLKLYALFREFRPDIVHTHNTHALLDGALAARLAGVPAIVHTEHGRQFPDKRRYMVCERLLSRWVTKIVAVSSFSKTQLVNHERIRPEKIEVIYNGTSFRDARHDVLATKSALSLIDSYPILGSVTRLSEEKGVRFLLEAMPEILCRFPRAALLVVGDGILRPQLERLVRELGVGDHVTFLGTQSDVSKFLTLVDIFVLASISEGLPLAVLEAMSHGKAIVATDVGGLREVLTDGDAGRLVPPRDSMAIAEAVKRLASDRCGLARAGARARAIYLDRFTEKLMVSNYQRLFLSCLQEAARR